MRKEESNISKLTDDRHCFACGDLNPHGLKLTFEESAEGLTSEFTPSKAHQGFKEIMHGGIMSLILDEMMINLAWAQGLNAVTAELNVKLIKPAKIGEKILLSAKIDNIRKKIVNASANAHRVDGTLLAEAEALCIKIKEN